MKATHPSAGLSCDQMVHLQSWADGSELFDEADEPDLAHCATAIVQGPARDRCSPEAQAAADHCLILVAGGAHVDRIIPLVRWGADIHAEDGRVLEGAVTSPAPWEALQACLACGADVHRRQDVALRRAVSKSHNHMPTAVITTLLDHGADPWQREAAGERPMAVDALMYPHIAAALLRIPEPVAQALDGHLYLGMRGQRYSPSAMASIVADPLALQRLTHAWRERPEIQAWAVNLMAQHLDEAWAPALLAQFGGPHA